MGDTPISDEARHLAPPPGQGIVGLVLLQGQPRRVPDVRQAPEYFEAHPDTRSELCVPLKAGERIIGVLNLEHNQPDAFSEADERLLVTLAGQLATAIDRLRTEAAERGQAQQLASLYADLQEQMAALQKTQAQLIHSEKMAALGRLGASIAHEINNPLQAVQSCLTLIQEELANGRRRDKLDRYLALVEGEIDRISDIVRRMRDFYRPPGQEQRRIDLHAVLENVLALTGKQLQHSRVAVERGWSDNLPLIQANADHLKQVFLNLILNAIDAMPQGGTLRISTALDQLQAGNGWLPLPAARLEFSDTGEGMSPETLAHLFEPFFTTKPGGSGLGLSISYGIIEAHRGQITATSQVGQGATFTILLPLEPP